MRRSRRLSETVRSLITGATRTYRTITARRRYFSLPLRQKVSPFMRLDVDDVGADSRFRGTVSPRCLFAANGPADRRI